MYRPTIRAAAGAAFLLAVAVTACGTASTTKSGTRGATPPASASASAPAGNGVATMSANRATLAAQTALTSAASVRVQGTFTANGRREHFDMRYADGSDASGSFTVNGGPIQTVNCGGAMYLKAGKDDWAAMGNPAGTSGMMVGRWFKVGPAQAPGTSPLSLAFFTSELAARRTSPLP